MSLFENIVSEMCLLLEDVEITSINDAISNLHPALIRYDDGEDDAKTGIRKIYPIAYGISTAGNPVVSAYQESGDSKRGVPKWKFFKKANITYWNTQEEETFNPEELYGFNKDGDARMDTVYNIAPVGQGKQYTKQSGEELTPIKPGPILKKDIEGSVEKKDNEKYTANDAVNDILRNISQKNIDNNKESEYNKIPDKINAPETTPVMKNDIKVQDIPVGNTEPEKTTLPVNEPVMKGDIKPVDDEPELTKSFNDMLKRMGNVGNKDEEDKEEI